MHQLASRFLRRVRRGVGGLAVPGVTVLVMGAAVVSDTAAQQSDGIGVEVRAPRDSFPHARHQTITCLQCHTSRADHGGVRFEVPAGCNDCHHEVTVATTCATCHSTETLPSRDMPLTVVMPNVEAATREVGFSHAVHGTQACTDCHSVPQSLATPPLVQRCQTCHVDHHAETSPCLSCHVRPDLQARHDLATAHQQCDQCHTRTTVALLTPTRSFCTTCHAQQLEHQEARECTVCHFLSDPANYRRRLLTPVGR